MTTGALIVCESTAAIVLHLRRLSPAGPRYTGGIDTPFLCGAKYLNGWDTRIPVEAFDGEPNRGPTRLCRGCRDARGQR